MGHHGEITPAKFQIIYADTFPTKRKEKHSSPLLKYRLHNVACFQRINYENGEKEQFKIENLANCTSARCSRSKAIVRSHVDSTTLDMMWWKCWFTSMVFPKTVKSMRKTNKSQLRDILKITRRTLLKMVKVIKNKEKSEKLCQEKLKGTGLLNVMWYPG